MSLTEQIEKMSEQFKLPLTKIVWQLSDEGSIEDSMGGEVARVRSVEESDAICKAVNSHDSLKSELEQAQKRIKELEAEADKIDAELGRYVTGDKANARIVELEYEVSVLRERVNQIGENNEIT